MNKNEFIIGVYDIIKEIPRGSVVTYGSPTIGKASVFSYGGAGDVSSSERIASILSSGNKQSGTASSRLGRTTEFT